MAETVILSGILKASTSGIIKGLRIFIKSFVAYRRRFPEP